MYLSKFFITHDETLYKVSHYNGNNTYIFIMIAITFVSFHYTSLLPFGCFSYLQFVYKCGAMPPWTRFQH